MLIELRPLSSIHPYGQNPRDNREAVAAVVESIRQFGFRQPIVVDPDGVIVCGHTRYLAAQELGLDEVPVHVVADLTEEQVRAYRIADNKTAELARWNTELLASELQALGGAGIDWSLLGFVAGELERLLHPGGLPGLTDPDHIPEPPAEAITRRGDIWICGSHKLHCGDSSSPADLDRLLDGEQIHLVNCDPPYNVAVEPRSNNAIAAGLSSFPATAGSKSSGRLRAKDRPIANDTMAPERFAELLRAWFGNAARVLAPGRSFYFWGGYLNCASYPAALADSGLYFSQAIIWVKDHPVMNRKDFMGNHEWCFYGWREGAAHQFFGGHSQPDTWELSRDTIGAVGIGRGVELVARDGSRIAVLPPDDRWRTRRIDLVGDTLTLCGAAETADVWRVKKVPSARMVHLTEKPVELAVRAMRCSSQPGENVLDLFGGSGSTMIAAQQTGWRAYLMEIDPLYCDVIVRRFREFTGQEPQLVREGETAKRPRRRRKVAK